MNNRVGIRWNDIEDKELLNNIEKGLQIAEIAKLHGRSEKGIDMHLKEIAYKMYMNNFSTEEINKKTRVSEFDLAEFSEYKRAKTEKKRSGVSKEEFNQIMEKLDKILKILEQVDIVS